MKTLFMLLLSPLPLFWGLAVAILAQRWDWDNPVPNWSWSDFLSIALIGMPVAFILAGLVTFSTRTRWWLGVVLFCVPASVGLAATLIDTYWSGSAAIIACLSGAFAGAMSSHRVSRNVEPDFV